ncbi:hypothetical protein GLOIN_2v1787103 [Rhizophagus irregularis DAOM 181602=DAOM 197198]|nr:hypothetical protein GLOIN_2v1787103 [Rhizophagus irregularis DAOM 181602=DAOM 197198]
MSSKMKSEIDSLRQENASLMAKITALESGKDELLKHGRENQGSRVESRTNNVRPNRGIVSLYENACNAEVNAIEDNKEEILCWCYYAKEFKYTDDKQDDNQNNALDDSDTTGITFGIGPANLWENEYRILLKKLSFEMERPQSD